MNESDRRDAAGDTEDEAPRSTETGVTTKGQAKKAPDAFIGVLRPLGVIDRGLAIFEAVVLAIGTLTLAIVSVANVFGRFVFGQSLYFAEELSQFLVILITFAGIGFAARHGRHIRMSALYDELPDLGRKIMMIIISVMTAGIMFVLTWYSYFYVLGVYDTGRISPVTRVPIFLTLIWLPLGFAITGIQYVLTAIANLTRPDVYLSVSVVDSYDDTETQV